MKPAPNKQNTPEPNPRAKSLKGWVGFVAVSYRIILVIGLLLLAATAVLIFFTRRTFLWVVPIPLIVIIVGVLLAHVEYRLYKQVHHSQDQDSNQTE